MFKVEPVRRQSRTDIILENAKKVVADRNEKENNIIPVARRVCRQLSFQQVKNYIIH